MRLDSLTWTFFFFWGGGFFKTFLERSVDHIIYRDYGVNRRSLIYCSLASGRFPPSAGESTLGCHTQEAVNEGRLHEKLLISLTTVKAAFTYYSD